ncbi:hypothetical protein V3C99_007220, partial [Haemonchus contortus]
MMRPCKTLTLVVLMLQGTCTAYANISFDYGLLDSLDCNYYRLERDYIVGPGQCTPVTAL